MRALSWMGPIAVGIGAIAACGGDATDSSAPPGADAGADVADRPDASGSDAGPDASPPRLPIKGSRLAPVFLESVDAAAGYRRYAGIHDTELDLGCDAMLAEDGKLRCFPSAKHSALERFADEACTKELHAEPPDACGLSKFVSSSIPDTPFCKLRVRIYRVGAAYAGTVYAKGAGGTCAPLPTPDADHDYYERTLLPAADFVEMTAAVDTVGGGIGEDVWAGADGSRFSQGSFVDLERGERCAPGFDVDGDVRCLPLPAGYTDGFTDAACTKPAFHSSSACGPPAPVTAVQEPAPGGGCYEDRARVRAVGAEVSPSAYHVTAAGGACIPGASLPPDTILREVGAELPASAFPAVEKMPPGSSRLVHRDYAAGGVPLGYQYGLPYDQTLGVPCFIVPGADGKRRCIPRSQMTTLFSDAACTARAVLEDPYCGNDNTHALLMAHPGDGCGLAHWRVMSVTGSLGKGVPVWRKDGGGTCAPSAINPEANVLAVGAEVPPSTFVEVTEVVR